MKIKDYINKINKERRKEIYGRRFKEEYDHITIWEEDKEWTGINKLMAEGKL